MSKRIRKEATPKVSKLLEDSGYIPFMDHNIPSNVSLENFRYYLKVTRSLKRDE